MTKVMYITKEPHWLPKPSKRHLVNKLLNILTMTPLENLYLAMGELAYAVACANGSIQKMEYKKLQDIIATELRNKNQDFDISSIIFQILQKDRFLNTETAYNWAIKEIKLNSYYLSPQLKATFITIMEKIAIAYPPVTKEEISLLERFKKDIASIKGDPIYYEQLICNRKENCLFLNSVKKHAHPHS